MTDRIALVGMACRYADANSPEQLWENVLAGRRAFRRLPAERLSSDYFSDDPAALDKTYCPVAAVIEGFEFDRERFRVAGSSFRSADMAHWLALDVAASALADAGFAGGEGLNRENTGVLLGNTLTGEFSRANLMRLRWPYVRRLVDTTLNRGGYSAEQRVEMLSQLEAEYKAPFAPVGDETLAGGLSNTIAGRICNHFDFKGGGYTLDGACASSLLAVANACSALTAGDLDVALAGGVDLSLDPFELVGFSKVGALAVDAMRVYDARSAGFWPGEGCGFVVLMRYADAIRQGQRIYATINGWGISSDGSGGITRPEMEGQLLALRRAYNRASASIEEVSYFEGHGTGTTVGDEVELQALSEARRNRQSTEPRAVVGSIKANIGHTKAAAGAAGLIKATLALVHQVLPPTTGCEEPHPVLCKETSTLRPLKTGMAWPTDWPLRAGVSAMGFGGINCHVVLEGVATRRRKSLSFRDKNLLSSYQDAELFLLSGHDVSAMQRQLAKLLEFAGRLSRAEMPDLAAQLARSLTVGPLRAAVVASTPNELVDGLRSLSEQLENSTTARHDATSNVHLGWCQSEPRIGFLFPGQGSPPNQDGGVWTQRFEFVAELYERSALSTPHDGVATDAVQPAVVTASMAALQVLERLGIEATVGIGHSLGELTAYHWSGALDDEALLRLATARGQAIARCGKSNGAMAGIAASADEVQRLLEGESVVISGLNSPRQTVVSGEASAIEALVRRAQSHRLPAVRLPVSHAFHSPLVADAVAPLMKAVAAEQWRSLELPVISTVTGEALEGKVDLASILARQMTSPVCFSQAVESVRDHVDLWIEVGPGSVLQGIACQLTDAPIAVLDAGGRSLRNLLQTVATAFVLGAPLHHRALFDGRFTRPFDLDWRPRFLCNPCEQASTAPTEREASWPSAVMQQAEAQPLAASSIFRLPSESDPAATRPAAAHSAAAHSAASRLDSALSAVAHPVEARSGTTFEKRTPAAESLAESNSASALDVVRQLAARHAELPLTAVGAKDRLLNDLHLSSLAVSQLFTQAARALNLAPPAAPMDASHATIAEVAQALEELAQVDRQTGGIMTETLPSGVDGWTRAFTIEFVDRPLPKVKRISVSGSTLSGSTLSGSTLSGSTLSGSTLSGSTLSGSTVSGAWQVVAPADHPFAEKLRSALNEQSLGKGVVVCLPSDTREHHVDLLLEAARAALDGSASSSFVLVQHGGGGAAFARSLHLELPKVSACVVDLPPGHAQCVDWILAESQIASSYHEAYYDQAGVRREAVLRLLPLESETPPLPLEPDDVLLVTGGGKGIAAECAFAMAKESGVRLALLGRSNPEQDAELANNLKRMSAAGVTHHYLSVDVGDRNSVQAAIEQLQAELGIVTAVLHGAGVNKPQRLASLDRQSFQNTLVPKVDGLCNVLETLDPEQLRLLVTFGSIIARAGMSGQADYALANQWLAELTDRWQADHPHCHCLAVEWSVWSGLGMGERLGRIQALKQQGVEAIPPDEGIRVLRKLIGAPLPRPSVVVTGRFGQPPTLQVERPELPLRRFLERPRYFIPGVELVVEADLSSDTDLYLNDHVYQGVPLLPAVMGIEAISQVAMALVGSSQPPVLENVEFAHPVIVPQGEPTTIRLAALATAPDRVSVVLRSQESSFQQDHFRAECRFRNDVADSSVSSEPRLELHEDEQPLDVDPRRDMYGGILFHRGRFRRVSGYRELRATECVAEIVGGDNRDSWFASYLPGELLLGDACARDAVIHCVQACIPHGTLLPIGIERLELKANLTPPLVVRARQRSQSGNLFVYDLEVCGEDGEVQERWNGLRLRRVGATQLGELWHEALLGPYLERRLQELLPGCGASVVLQRGSGDGRRACGDRAIQSAVGASAEIHRRPDGKPEVCCAQEISVSHADHLTLAIAGDQAVACDVEAVTRKSTQDWSDLLGVERFALAQLIAKRAGEELDAAATRVWSAGECLQKAAVGGAPLMIDACTDDHWVLLKSGQRTVATYVAPLRERPHKLSFAMLVRSGGDSI